MNNKPESIEPPTDVGAAALKLACRLLHRDVDGSALQGQPAITPMQLAQLLEELANATADKAIRAIAGSWIGQGWTPRPIPPDQQKALARAEITLRGRIAAELRARADKMVSGPGSRAMREAASDILAGVIAPDHTAAGVAPAATPDDPAR
jgi:hypothetical protein